MVEMVAPRPVFCYTFQCSGKPVMGGLEVPFRNTGSGVSDSKAFVLAPQEEAGLLARFQTEVADVDSVVESAGKPTWVTLTCLSFGGGGD